MRFSEAFGIERAKDEDWFDPHLTVDTKLFVDPLRLLLAGDYWAEGHEELLAHFIECYRLVARAVSPTSASAKVARRLLTFPEPSEFGLGYTRSGTSGSGSGKGFAKQTVDGIAVAIARGLDVPEHIEEIGILNEGLGADRLSDAVCNVLKHRFISYTQDVANRLDISMESHRVKNARCFPEHGRWLTEDVLLPTNKATGQPVILCPMSLLNDLPTLNAEEWFESDLNEDLRLQVNLSLGRQARKAEIVDIARRHPERVREWARQQTSRRDLSGYDFEKDPKGVVQWDGRPVAFAISHPIEATKPASQEELSELVERMLLMFKRFIEEQRGWSLLWKDSSSTKPEEAIQLLFLGMAQHYLRLFDVEVDREVELGRGPVDFKLASGTAMRLLIEIKKEHNGKFWHGLADQLPSYLASDDCSEGWYVAVRFRGNKESELRMKELPKRVAEVQSDTGKRVRFVGIDARRPPSASNI